MDLNRIYQVGCSSLYITILLPRKMIVYRLALMRPNVNMIWSGRRDSNPRLSAWEANTLPLSYARKSITYSVLYHEKTPTVTKTSQIRKILSILHCTFSLFFDRKSVKNSYRFSQAVNVVMGISLGRFNILMPQKF